MVLRRRQRGGEAGDYERQIDLNKHDDNACPATSDRFHYRTFWMNRNVTRGPWAVGILESKLTFEGTIGHASLCTTEASPDPYQPYFPSSHPNGDYTI